MLAGLGRRGEPSLTSWVQANSCCLGGTTFTDEPTTDVPAVTAESAPPEESALTTMKGAVASLAIMEEWCHAGSEPVLVCQGFTGLGKSWAARELVNKSKVPSVLVTVPWDGCTMEDLLFMLAEELESIGQYTMMARPGCDLLASLEDQARNGCLIAIDNFQELFEPESLTPPATFLATLQRIGSRGGQGRILLITNQSLRPGPWSDHLGTLTFLTPSVAEATETLSKHLDAHGVGDAVPLELRPEVAKWLGCNPRALQVLSVCLQFDPLEELIGLEQELWDTRNENLSPKLLAQLEARFMGRALIRLDTASVVLLQNLSVYRVPFTSDAIERQERYVGDLQGPKEKLVGNFLLELHRNWYSIHPLARQLGLTQLARHKRSRELAHRMAADHYSRHFRAQTLRHHLAVGKSLVEARYHLLATNQDDEFASIAGRFRSQLLSAYSGTAPKLPQRPDQQNELLQTIAAALSDTDGGFAALRYILARLLVARGRSGDSIAALNQMREVVRSKERPDRWILYLRLLGAIEGPDAVISAAKAADSHFPNSAMEQIYAYAAKVATLNGDIVAATAFLSEGLANKSDSWGTYVHQLLSGLLLRQARYIEAQTATLSALRSFDTDHKFYHRLIECALFPALARRDMVTIKEVRSIAVQAARPEWITLCASIAFQCSEDYQMAAITAETELDYPACVHQAAFGWLVAGDSEKASKLLNGTKLVRDNPAIDWLTGLVALRSSRGQLALMSLERSIDKSLSDEEALDPNLWLRIWDRVPIDVQVYPSFYFPRLPPSLTGLDHTLVRLASDATALTESVLASLNFETTLQSPGALVDEDREHSAVVVNINNVVSPSSSSAVNSYERYDMSDTYNVNQAGAVGREAQALNPVFNQVLGGDLDTIDLATLSAELRKLGSHLQGNATDENEKEATMIELAAQSADQGDRAATRSNLARLSGWVVGAATAIGTSLAAAAIRSATGL